MRNRRAAILDHVLSDKRRNDTAHLGVVCSAPSLTYSFADLSRLDSWMLTNHLDDYRFEVVGTVTVRGHS